MLFSLSVFTLIVSSLFPLLLFFYQSVEGYRELNDLEWEFFSEQAMLELKSAVDPAVTGETLSFKNSLGQSVTYQRYQNYIRRQINKSGNEMVLQKVQHVQFEVKDNHMVIVVKSLNGTLRSLTVRSIYNEVM